MITEGRASSGTGFGRVATRKTRANAFSSLNMRPRYHRGSAADPANLVSALAALLADPPADQSDWVHWLP